MVKRNISYTENIEAQDYSYAVSKEWVLQEYTSTFSRVEKRYQAVFKLILVEFNKIVILDTLDNLEQQALKLIQKEMEISTDLPMPRKIALTYTGRLSLRIDPDLHHALHIESIATGESINSLIEKRINNFKKV